MQSCKIDLGPFYETTCGKNLPPGETCQVSCRKPSLGGSVILTCPLNNLDSNNSPSGVPPPCYSKLF